jgi:hypothetical protein
MLESFDIKQCKMRYTGSVKTFELLNSFGVLYKGNLMWHEDCGYEVWWDTDAPDISHRPEFEHILDSILEHKYND